MNRALLYLLATSKRGALLRFARGLGQPRRAFGVLLWVGLLALLAWSQHQARSQAPPDPEVWRRPLTLSLAMIVLFYAIGGLLQRGLSFRPGEVDLLFTAPLSRRSLVIYKLLNTYPVLLLSAAVIFLFLAASAPNPALTLCGIVLCLICGLHLQVLASLLAARITDTAFARLRRPIQALAFAVSLLGLGLIAGLVADRGGIRNLMDSALESPWIRALFYPAVATSELAARPPDLATSATLLGLLMYALGSLGLLLLVQVNFLEASLGTSQRHARIVARMRRGGAPIRDGEDAAVRRIRLPRLNLFRGAGAVVWMNLHVAGRSLRMLVGAAILTSIFLMPAMLSSTTSAVGVLVAAAMPLFLQAYLPFDFRRDPAYLESLKTLPVSARTMAAAQITVPTLMVLLLQTGLLTVLLILDRLESSWLLAALLACPAIDVAAFAVTNIAFLLFPPRGGAEPGRAGMGSALSSTLVSFIGTAGALLPAILAGFAAWKSGVGLALVAAAGIVVQVLVDWLLVDWLGWLFTRSSPVEDAA